MPSHQPLRFVPSQVEGLVAVTEVVIHPDRLDFLSEGKWIHFRLADIAEWPRPKWLWRFLFCFGYRPRCLPVADRDWFHLPPERFFRFYTEPPIVVHMPEDESLDLGKSTFLKVQQVLREGGFITFDLG